MYHTRRRKPNRLRDFDYPADGWYFVTVCVQNRECLFGQIENGQMILNEAGLMLGKIWNELPQYYPGVDIDEFIIMPNHVHGIIIINRNVGTGPRACPPTPIKIMGQPQGVVPTTTILSLSDVVHRFKSFTATHYLQNTKQNNWPPFYQKLWQRSYHDHIIRNEKSYWVIKEYIRNNPANWLSDEENPYSGQPRGKII